MNPSWDRVLNIGLVFIFLIFSFAWPIVFFILIIAFVTLQISQIQWEHNLLLEGNFVIMLKGYMI